MTLISAIVASNQPVGKVPYFSDKALDQMADAAFNQLPVLVDYDHRKVVGHTNSGAVHDGYLLLSINLIIEPAELLHRAIAPGFIAKALDGDWVTDIDTMCFSFCMVSEDPCTQWTTEFHVPHQAYLVEAGLKPLIA